MFKLTGYYQLPGQMPQPVDFSDLFDTAFMRRYTRCRSFEKPVHSQADFEALPEAQMDAHVRRTTKFSSWKEMLDTATDIYARHAQLRQASQK